MPALGKREREHIGLIEAALATSRGAQRHRHQDGTLAR